MARRVLFHPAAAGELEALYDDVAERASPRTALRFVSGIQAYCRGLSDFSERGTERHWIVPGLRVVGFRRSVSIAFSADGDAVFILGIFGRGRDVTAELIEQRLAEPPET